MVCLDERQRVIGPGGLHGLATRFNADGVVNDANDGVARQADERVAAPPLSPLRGLEQVTVGTVRQLEICRKRCFEIGGDFPHDRNAVIASRCQSVEVLLVHLLERSFPNWP